MNNISKFVVGAIVIVIFIFLFAAIVHSGGKSGGGPGVLGIFLVIELIGALRAIFKKE